MNNTVNKKVVLLVTTLSSFLAPFMGSLIFVELLTIGKKFSISGSLRAKADILVQEAASEARTNPQAPANP